MLIRRASIVGVPYVSVKQPLLIHLTDPAIVHIQRACCYRHPQTLPNPPLYVQHHEQVEVVVMDAQIELNH